MATTAQQAIRRLKRDLDHLEKNPNTQFMARPSSKSLLEWHFVLHQLPAETPYGAGCYHGKLTFPETYPMAPPALIMLTPNGRLETNSRLCLSMTDFHPESWNPAWTVESLLVGVVSFLVDDKDTVGFGSIAESKEVRQSLALKSWEFNRKNVDFRELFPEVLEAPASCAAMIADKQEGPGVLQSTAPAGQSAPARAGVETDPVPERPQTVMAEKDSAPAAAVPEDSDSGGRIEITISDIGDAQGIAAPVPAAPSGPDATAKHQVDLPAEDSEASRQGAQPEVEEPQGPAVDKAAESTAEECWICREDVSLEPLIQPCACRGSMSGVHGSCVEAWIAHHRANADGDEMPKCSVCGVTYMGEEKRPGIVRYFKHMCIDFLWQAARGSFLVVLLVCYWAAAQPAVIKSLPARIVLLTVSGSFFLYKSLVLTVSMPCGRPPPAGPERFLFTADFQSLIVMVTELLMIVVISTFWCAKGHFEYYYVIPLVVMLLLPMVAILLNGYASAWRSFRFLITIIASPILVTVQMIRIVWRNPRRLVDPRDGVMHAVFAVAVMLTSWICKRNTTPLIALWACHSAILIIGILDKRLRKRATWREGRAWWIFAKLAGFAAYIANLRHTFTSDDRAAAIVFASSLTWLGLATVLSFMVNWAICVDAYHSWQQRNGQFRLSPRSGHGQEIRGAATEPGGHESLSQPGGQVIGHRQQDEPAPVQLV